MRRTRIVVTGILIFCGVLGCGKDPAKQARHELARRKIPYAEAFFFDSVHKGDAPAVRLFLQAGMSANVRDSEGRSALHFAAEDGSVEIAEILLDNGGDVNAANRNGGTPLMWARSARVASLLLDRGADARAKTSNGTTALMMAAQEGKADVARVLSERGADVNAKTANGSTALMVAAGKGNVEIVKVLLEAGADVNARADSGNTALMIASAKGNGDVMALLKKAGAKG
jgi:ankyrin repeat protein